MIKPYLRDMINVHKTPMKIVNNKTTCRKLKIQLIMLNKCISNKHFLETCDIYSQSKNIEIFMGRDTDNIVDELFKTLLQWFQDAREKSNERESEFIHEFVNSLCYILYKISPNKAKSHIESREWLKNRKATINPKKWKKRQLLSVCYDFCTKL